MRLRRVLLVVSSGVLGIAMVLVLMRLGNVNWHEILHLMRNTKCSWFLCLILLNVLLVFVSTQKWRLIDSHLCGPADSRPSVIESFAITSAGMALGLVIPTQLGMTAARTMGTHSHGHALKRGAAATIFEQASDVVIVGLFAIASVLTYVLLGNGALWAVAAATIIGFAFLLAGPSVSLMRRLAARADSDQQRTRLLKLLSDGLIKLQRLRCF